MKNNTITKYTIIDHIGSLESSTVNNKAYAIANALSKNAKTETFSMKAFVQKISGRPEVSKAQKNWVRWNKNPNQVILIVPLTDATWDDKAQKYTWDDHDDYCRISSKNKWWAETWASRVEDVTILAVNEEHTEIITMKELHPEWYSEKRESDTRYRMCAEIWSSALGWTFSNPLTRPKTSEIDVMRYKRKDQELYKDEPGAHYTKTNHSPESYLKSKGIASEEECKEFFEYYKYLQQNGLLKEFLQPGYQICPECGRPIHLDKAVLDLDDIDTKIFESIPEHKDDRRCDHCNFRIPAKYISEISRYWDDSYREEDEEF